MPKSATNRRAALLAGLAAVWLVLTCAPTLAHATLVGASPPQGGEVSKPPEHVRLRFNEPVDAAFDPLKVYDAQGKRMDEHNARIDSSDARDLLVDLKKLPEGSYRVEWRVTSIDGHVIEDAYAFNVSANASETQGGAQAQAQYAEGPGAKPAARKEPGPSSQEENTGGLDRTVLFGVLTFGLLGLVVLALIAAKALRQHKSRGIQ
jgi:methionine-rich copper-binding protein CopC